MTEKICKMPPNILQNCWDSSVSIASNKERCVVGRKHDYNYDDDDAADAFDNSYESFEPFFRDDRDYPNCCSSKTDPKSAGRRMWEKILQEEVTVKSDLVAALSGIRVLADEIDNTEWLKHFQGRLSAISPEILQRLRYVNFYSCSCMILFSTQHTTNK